MGEWIGRGRKARRAYGFDEIAIVPGNVTINPDEVDISWQVGEYKFDIPIIGAAMDGVVDPNFAVLMGKAGGFAVLNLEGVYTRYDDPYSIIQEIIQSPPEKATELVQRLYQPPVKEELISKRIEEIKSKGAPAVVSCVPQVCERYGAIAQEAGLKLDSEGWIKIDDLIRGIREVWRNKHLYQWVTRDHILAIAALDPKGRFEIRDNYIRACYGHSIKADLKYKEDTKVKILYHGTTEEAWAKIRYEGLKPGRRLWVHLSGNINDAYEVARRHGSRIVILLIDIECLRRRGIKIFKASKSVWVVKYVPPECIKRIR